MQSGQSHVPDGFLNLLSDPRPNEDFEEDMGDDLAANAGLWVSQAWHCLEEPGFLTKHVLHSQLSLAGLNLLPNPDPETMGFSGSLASDGLCPVLTTKHFLHAAALHGLCSWQELHSHTSSNALDLVFGHAGVDVVKFANPTLVRGVSQAMHFVASLLLRIMQSPHSQVPGAGLNLSKETKLLELSSFNSSLSAELGFFPKMSITLPDFNSVAGLMPKHTSLF
jgi:hypothetical protein